MVKLSHVTRSDTAPVQEAQAEQLEGEQVEILTPAYSSAILEGEHPADENQADFNLSVCPLAEDRKKVT